MNSVDAVPAIGPRPRSGGPVDERPLVVHVVYRFAVGGLENGVVNLLNHMPPTAYRHAVVALTETTAFRDRISRADVEVIALHKAAGHGIWLYPALYRLFRRLRPAIVHTRNLAALEAVVPARLAGVPVCIHGEHGREIDDLDGSRRRYRWMRRAYRPFVDQYVALSEDLARYLTQAVRIPAGRVTQLCNGVDANRFAVATGPTQPPADWPFTRAEHWVLGTVGRMAPVKNPVALARAFVRALQLAPELAGRLRLAIVGDGSQRSEVDAVLAAAGASRLAWLPGERTDIPALMRGFDAFVLPSLAEGISNTVLEAMASGLPVIATAVGGNVELVSPGRTGLLVPPADDDALARAILALAGDRGAAVAMGRAARLEVERRFSLDAMVAAYQQLYDTQLRRAQVAPAVR